jgi:hypothetical protein
MKTIKDKLKRANQQYDDKKFKELLRDAERWRKLIRLCGYLGNSSQETVTIYQDDATNTAFVTVGTGDRKRKYYGGERCGIEAAIDSIPESDLETL